MKVNSLIMAGFCAAICCPPFGRAQSTSKPLLDPAILTQYIHSFAAQDDGKFPAFIDAASIPDWLRKNVPLFECPEHRIEEIYYFRWYSYLKHIRPAPGGYVITEFLPNVPWAGKDNTISAASGHHIYEGRWIRDPQYMDEYSRFWFRHGGAPRLYSCWLADAIWARYLVTGHPALPLDLLPDLERNFEEWEKSHYDKTGGLFQQIDDRDGMEVSIGGSGFRPTINSYMYGDAMAISQIASLAGNHAVARAYAAKAGALKEKVEQSLWDPDGEFFKTLPGQPGARLVHVREEIGFTPWYFNLPDAAGGYEAAWKQLMDPRGFFAPFGPATAERRDPKFMAPFPHDCLWNGPSWPYATTQTLVALANLLDNYSQNIVTRDDYLKILTGYADSQYREGKPWIAEDIDPITGKWIVDKPRSVYYNHSGYADLIITGLIGLRPRSGDVVDIRPLAPPAWDYFCLQDVPYHGHLLTLFYDKTGRHYHRGRGLHVLSDGHEFIHSGTLRNVNGTLPESG